MASAHVPSLPCFVSHIPCPHLRPCPDRTAGPEALLCSVRFPRRCPSTALNTFPLLHSSSSYFSFCTNVTNTHPHNTASSSNAHLVHSCPRHGGKSPPHLVLYGGFLEGDLILFPLPRCLAGWLAPLQHGVRWRGLSLGQCAQKLMNCRRDAGRQPARSSSERPSRTITVCSCDGGNRRDGADNLI